MIRRVAIWTVALIAILAQVAVGIAGPHGTLCVCSTCISVQGPGESCGPDADARETNAIELVVIGSAGCTDCHPSIAPPAAAAPSPRSSPRPCASAG